MRVDNGEESKEGTNARKKEGSARRRLWYVAGVLVGGGLVVLGAARTLRRNADWADDAALFTAAEEVCPDSAKVQLNMGILARRGWSAGLHPSFCQTSAPHVISSKPPSTL